MNLEQSILIRRPVNDVWRYLSDVRNAPEWDRGVLAARQTSRGPAGVGTRIETVRQFLGRRRVGCYQVTEYEPNRAIALSASLGLFRGRVRYSMEPAGEDTRLTATASGELVGPYRLIAPTLMRMLTRDGEADLANLKRLLEGQSGEGSGGSPRAAVQARTWVEGRHARSSVATWVRALPEQAFAYVADMPRHREWAMDEITVTPISPGAAHLGSRYKSIGRQVGKEWPSDLEIAAFEPPRRFEFTATGGPIGTPDGDPHRHEFLFSPESGGTRLELRRTDPAPPSWPSWGFLLIGPFLLRASLRHRVETVERLRSRLEQISEGAEEAA